MNTKQERLLAIFYRALRGENLSVKKLAIEYSISTKSITRDINSIKEFLAEHRDLLGNSELNYSYKDKYYRLCINDFLLEPELFAIVKVILGSRAFNKIETIALISKLKLLTSTKDRKMLDGIVQKEIYHYHEVKHDCHSIIDNLWKLINTINERKEITITYYKMDRVCKERRIKPIAILFSEYYFYLIAFHSEDETCKPIHYRVDRIYDIVEHRRTFPLRESNLINEGQLREKIQFMFPGKSQKIQFEYTGPSVQAILDRIPTAKVIEVKGNISLIKAEIMGDGIKMYLLSQGSWVKVISPLEFVEEMKGEIKKMMNLYC